MKIAIINGNVPHYDHGLGKVISTVANTLAELGVDLEETKLAYSQVPYFDGSRSHASDEIVARIKAADGVIFACTAQLFAPSAMMMTFLEFLECPDYKDVFKGKHCMSIMVSKFGGERSGSDYLTHIIQHLGGYENGRIAIQESHTRELQDSASGESPAIGSVRDIIEKTAEDYYRAIRQDRRYIVPLDMGNAPPPIVAPVNTPSMYTTQGYQQGQNYQPNYQAPQVPQMAAATMQAPIQAPMLSMPQQQPSTGLIPAASINQSQLNLNRFTEEQEQDIRELTAMFAPPKQTNSSQNTQSPVLNLVQTPRQQTSADTQAANLAARASARDAIQSPLSASEETPVPRVKTVKQLTQSLPHYYQPQMAVGLTAIIQLSINGAEDFEGYLTIVDNECEYSEGQAQNPEITIISDTNTWNDVLKGKHTAQKAFMIGGLKVRGNFVLLTKFDAMFKVPKA